MTAVLSPAADSLAARTRAAFRRAAWAELVAMAAELPAQLDVDALPAADDIAFALGQDKQHVRAIALLGAAHVLEPTARRASALAYLHYAALMEGCDDVGAREAHRDGFRRFVEEALGGTPIPVKELYRLGVYEAQIESAHDKPALRAFLAAIAAYRGLDAATRAKRHDLRKYFVRALYAAARSALRLGDARTARTLVFDCIREDGTDGHVPRVFSLGLAAKICLATGELDAAERAARLALDADGPPRRDHLFAALAEIARRRGDYLAAARFIEANVRAERRSPYLWRLLGDIRADAGDAASAVAAWQSALTRDRAGRHLTLCRIAEAHLALGQAREAERDFRAALDFRRRRYASEDPRALAGLEKLGVPKDRAPEPRLAKVHPIARKKESAA